MNKIAEKIASFLGSAWVIGLFGLWLIVHTVIQKDYIAFISELAILIGFLILRAESVQSERMEYKIDADKRYSREVLQLLKGKKKGK